jgi:hypothetical protein
MDKLNQIEDQIAMTSVEDKKIPTSSKKDTNETDNTNDIETEVDKLISQFNKNKNQ